MEIIGLDNQEYSDQLQKIRERTFNAEFKELVDKVALKPKDEMDTPQTLLQKFHELYYSVASKSFDQNAQFINLEQYNEHTLVFCREELSRKLTAFAFDEHAILQYDVRHNYHGIVISTFKENIFREFYVSPSESIYKKLMEKPEGILLPYSALSSESAYSKRLEPLHNQDFSLWLFSSYHLINKAMSYVNVPFPKTIEVFCPVFIMKVDAGFGINEHMYRQFQTGLIHSTIALIDTFIAVNKGSVFLSANYFHELYGIFENFYHITRSNNYTKCAVVKSHHENQSIYCLFKYLHATLKDASLQSSITFRPMIGLIIVFISEENNAIEDHIKNIASLFSDLIKVSLIDSSEIKNAVHLYEQIIHV